MRLKVVYKLGKCHYIMCHITCMNLSECYFLTITDVTYYLKIWLSASLKTINTTFSSTELDPTCFPRTISLFFYASIISRIRAVRHTAAPLLQLGVLREKKTTNWCFAPAKHLLYPCRGYKDFSQKLTTQWRRRFRTHKVYV